MNRYVVARVAEMAQEVKDMATQVEADYLLEEDVDRKVAARRAGGDPYPWIHEPRLQGQASRRAALKRRSMDLTKLLAKMRKP